MTRLELAAFAAALVLTGLVTACASADAERAASAGDTIVLRARIDHGVWQRGLSLKLVKSKLISFTLCAVWDSPVAQRFRCAAPDDARLPAGTTMRLEQSPVGKAVKRPESPGWGMLATSSTASLGAVLSNTVTGDVLGRFRYRVTLRDTAGNVLLSSNLFPIDWHR